jgi:nucleoside phosphorylase
VEGVDCLLYSADEMGRVPAALATMQLLSNIAPRHIVVVGIAGGFESEGVEEGHLLIPLQIADLATRKIRQDEVGARPQFRPRAFDAGQQVIRYLNGAQFQSKKADWEQAARKEGEWPRGRVPALDHLLKAWPKLKGVEMEAGGVCAAARELGNVPVTVIRGVSDLADPLKADDAWRRRSMKTLATLLEFIFRDRVIP